VTIPTIPRLKGLLTRDHSRHKVKVENKLHNCK